MSASPSAGRVLVVDDESHILHVVRMKLSNAGFEVETAMDGEEGFETALAFRPDLVITDYQMPYMTGLELCRKMRRSEELAAVPALMLTARGFALEARQLEGTNILAVLSKPFSPREVLMKVQELIERAAAPRA